MELESQAGSIKFRPAPSTYQPTSREFKMMEQTLQAGGVRVGKQGPTIVDTPDYTKWYNRAAELFDAEGHHIIDLAWVDKTLYKAGLTSGAKGSTNYSAERHQVLDLLNKAGVITGNDRQNIAPLSQNKPAPFRAKTGKQHTWVHDLYNSIPEPDPEQLRGMSVEQLADYMIDSARQRKDIVIQAMTHKLDQFYKLKPNMANASHMEILRWIRRNRQTWGELGDKTFKDVVQVRQPGEIPPVPNVERGRVGFSDDPLGKMTEKIAMGTQKGYLMTDPITPVIKQGLKSVKQNPMGAVAGAGLDILTDKPTQEAILQGDVKTAATRLGTSAVAGSAVGSALKAAPAVARVVGPAAAVTTGAALFNQGQTGSFIDRAVNKAATVVPGLKPDPNTDLGKRALNELKYMFGTIRYGGIPYMR